MSSYLIFVILYSISLGVRKRRETYQNNHGYLYENNNNLDNDVFAPMKCFIGTKSIRTRSFSLSVEDTRSISSDSCASQHFEMSDSYRKEQQETSSTYEGNAKFW